MTSYTNGIESTMPAEQLQNLEKLHKVFLSMLVELREKCKENDINFYLFYGTMLGAVRHQGFIPWDDDVDLLMTRKDLEKFVSLYKDSYSSDCYLDAYNCSSYRSYAPNLKINNKSVFLLQARNGCVEKVPAFISIWIIDGLPDEPQKKKKHIKRIFRCFGLLRLARSAVNGTNDVADRSKKEKILVLLNRIFHIGKLISPRTAAKMLNDVQKQYPMDAGEECIIGWNPAGKRIYKRKWLEDSRKVSLEGEEFYIPIGYEEMLQLEYGDYMSLPPVKKRIPEHGFVICFE